MELDAGVCAVRPWRAADAPSLVAHANNRRVWLHLRDAFPHPYTSADADRWLALAAAAEPPTHWAVAVDGAAVGGIGLVVGTDVARLTAELGYWLGEPFWGRGIVTAAVRAVTRHAFAALPLERVFALPFGPNRASQRVLEKAGFTREGVLRRAAVKDGRVLDHVVYAILRAEVDRG